MADLQAVLVREGISKEGLKAVKDNEVDMEMLKLFGDADVVDLFKIFKDRFLIRQLLKKLNERKEEKGASKSAVYVAPPVIDQDDADLDDSLVIDSDNLASPSTPKQAPLPVPCKYSVEEMVCKKPKRGKPSEAQKHFAAILRDAATVAKIWKKTPVLSSIPASKKEAFFDAISNVCPELLSCRQIVWEGLGKRLQNRRKYLQDKEAGKRTNKRLSSFVAQVIDPMKKKDDVKPSSSDALKTSGPVNIRSSDGRVLGQGIFVRSTSSMYAEVVLKKIFRNNVLEGDELPEKSGTACLFSELQEKQLFVWKLSNLLPVPVKQPKSQPNQQKHVQSKLLFPTKTSTPSTSSHPKKANTESSKTSERVTEASTSSQDKIYIPGTVSPKSSMTETSVNIVAMEWSGGKVYLGVRRKSGRLEEVTSATVPVAKILKDESYVLCRSDIKRGLAINSSDVQRKPDSQYLVWNVPDHVCSLSHDGKFLKLAVPHEEFFEKLDTQMTEYVKY